MDLQSNVDELQALCKEISENAAKETLTDELSEKLFNLLDKLPSLDSKNDDHRALHEQMETCAVSLWNLAVAKKTGGTLKPALNARLRHISCHLVFMCNTNTSDETTLQKQIMMSMKTARAWLDCKNPAMAEGVLSMATECIEKVKCLLIQHQDGSADKDDNFDRKKLQVEKDFFKVLCYKAEAACEEGNHKEALPLIQQAKEFINRLPQEVCFLSMLCYNFGVDCFQGQLYEDAVGWLRESYEIGKGHPSVTSKNQARTLRLLANAYLEWDSKQHWQKALNVIGLANAEFSHAAGLYLKVRILLQGDATDERLKSGLEDILKHPELNVDLGINTIKLVTEFNRHDVAFEGIKELAARFGSTPDHGKVSIAQLEMLLQAKRDAKPYVEECIVGHNTGKTLDVDIRKRFHLLLWEQAAQAYEAKDYTEALEWYNYSLSFFSNDDQLDKEMAKLHRNRASCYLGLNKLEKAEDAMSQAEKCDPESPYTLYLAFKLALTQGKEEKAIDVIVKLGSLKSGGSKEDDANVQGLVCLASQLALEQSNRNIAVSALDCLIKHSTNNQQVLTALRCLIRLKLTFIEVPESSNQRREMSTVLSYIKMAYDKMCALSDAGQTAGIEVQNEATWFMKVAWNMALKCQEAYKDMSQFFSICCKLLTMCPSDLASLIKQKTCLLMAAAADLQVARMATEEVDKRCALKEAISHIDNCRQICKLVDGDSSGTKPKDMTSSVLMILYEFEARSKLGDPHMENVLEQALALPQAEPKAFETIAALALESPSPNRSLSIRALKIAIKKHIQQQNVDFTKCSKAFHSLIELALEGGISSDPSSYEEAWGYYIDVVDVIENRAKDNYPEMEMLWLMTKAWNCGIHLYSATKYSDAVKWCELSMKLLNNLNTLKDDYQQQMMGVYSEILEKVDKRDKTM